MLGMYGKLILSDGCMKCLIDQTNEAIVLKSLLYQLCGTFADFSQVDRHSRRVS